jgi:hypothetical protein
MKGSIMKKIRKRCKRTAKKVTTKKTLRALNNARQIAEAAYLTKAAIIALKVAV